MGESNGDSIFEDGREPKFIKVNFDKTFVLPVEKVDNLIKQGNDLE